MSTAGSLQKNWHWYSPDRTNEVWRGSGIGTVLQADACKAISTLYSRTDRQSSKEANQAKENVPSHLGGRAEMTVFTGEVNKVKPPDVIRQDIRQVSNAFAAYLPKIDLIHCSIRSSLIDCLHSPNKAQFQGCV